MADERRCWAHTTINMKTLIIVFLFVILLNSCNQVSTPVQADEPGATFTKAPTVTTIVTPTLVTKPTSEPTSLAEEGSKKCQQIDQVGDYPSHLDGTLIYGKNNLFDKDRFNEVYAFQFPSLKETTFFPQNENKDYYYPEISPNGNFLAVLDGLIQLKLMPLRYIHRTANCLHPYLWIRTAW